MKKTFIAGILVLSVLAFPVAGKAQLLDAIQQALIAAIDANKAAFEWGRQAAHRPGEMARRLNPGQVIEFK